MSSPRVVIVHGWGGQPGDHWVPWLRTKLEQAGYEVVEPAMPDTDAPNIEKWVNHLADIVGNVNEQTYFVGHSIGCQTILRYLETQTGKKAGGCVFVAGWFKLDNLEDENEEAIAKPWIEQPINFSNVLNVTKNFVVINSSNDDYGFIEENKRLFEENLDANVVILQNKGHLTKGDGVTELPEAFKAIQEFTA